MHATDRTEEYRAVLDALDPHIALLDRSGTIVAAREGITQVLAGARSSFAMEYPCHAPDEERWFV
nr:hypothetical protein [Chloroflexia bacterium]